jgi:hypothetical protein
MYSVPCLPTISSLGAGCFTARALPPNKPTSPILGGLCNFNNLQSVVQKRSNRLSTTPRPALDQHLQQVLVVQKRSRQPCAWC